MELRSIADWTVRPRLLGVTGVSQVMIIGGDTKQYQVVLSADRLRAYQLSAGEVVRAIAWLGAEKAGEALRKLRFKLQPSELEEVASVRARLPTWMAQEFSALLAHG